MKKFIKKSSTILLISLLAILMLVGCGSQNSETGVSENDATPTSAIAEEESEESVEPTTTPEASEEPTSTPNPTEAPEATEEPESTPEPTEEPEPTEKPHTHSWSNATCTSPKTCECGETSGNALGHNFVDNKKTCTRCNVSNPNYVAPHTHSYTSQVTSPTCTSDGYTTHTCSCGDSYIDNYTTGSHNYSNGTCTTCGASDPNYHVHSWTEHTWTEDVVDGHMVEVYVCGCNIEWATIDECMAHRIATPQCGGWSNNNKWVETITQIIHHYRECACGAREDID